GGGGGGGGGGGAGVGGGGEEGGRHVVVAAEHGVGAVLADEAAGEPGVVGLAHADEPGRDRQPPGQDRLAGPGDPGVDRGRRVRAHGERQLAATQLQQVVGQGVAAGEVVDAHQGELAPRGAGGEGAVQQHDGEAGPPQV